MPDPMEPEDVTLLMPASQRPGEDPRRSPARGEGKCWRRGVGEGEWWGRAGVGEGERWGRVVRGSAVDGRGGTGVGGG